MCHNTKPAVKEAEEEDDEEEESRAASEGEGETVCRETGTQRSLERASEGQTLQPP